MNEFIISIIVPTKNRQEYAAKTAEQILSIKNEKLQLVIQDNSTNNNLEKMLSHLMSDRRIKYNYNPKILSFVDNFELALSIADGKYVCFIGDDDGINPEIIRLAEWANENKINAIKPQLQAVYFWPNAIQKNDSEIKINGFLKISNITKKVRISDTSKELRKLLKNGFQDYLSLDLVKLYHGLVSKEALDKVHYITGKYFGGLSPDIYISVALSSIIPKIVCIDYPLTISGICNKSGSADSATGKHTGKLREAPHFIGNQDYVWSSLVPPFYSVETIWADSAISAARNLNVELINFNMYYLTSYCLKNYKDYTNIIKEHFYSVKIKKREKLKLRFYILYFPLLWFLKRTNRRLKKGKIKLEIFDDVININEAQKKFSSYLLKNDINLNQIIASLDKII
jgi:glycosyltransferase involved in cell wall biosynthesis